MEIIFSDSPVYDLQTCLWRLSALYPSIPRIIPDGIFGPETKSSVQAFQREFGLNPTGQVEEETWRVLFSAFQEANRFQSLPGAFCLFRRPAGGYGLGDVGDIVYMLQVFINALAKKYNNIPAVPVDGVYQGETLAGVQAFQACCGIDPTGVTNQETWERLVRLCTLCAQGEMRQ